MADRRRRVVWADQARSALGDIVSYVAQDSIQGARAVLEEALGAADGLTTLSNRGRVVPELGDTSIREVFVGSYGLIYEIAEAEVRVLVIVHGARDFAKWLDDVGDAGQQRFAAEGSVLARPWRLQLHGFRSTTGSGSDRFRSMLNEPGSRQAGPQLKSTLDGSEIACR